MKQKTRPDPKIEVQIRFVSIMQRYSGERDFKLKVPPDPAAACDFIIQHYNIPWKDKLEKSTRIFINKQLAQVFIKSGKNLQEGDSLVFIPISGGG